MWCSLCLYHQTSFSCGRTWRSVQSWYCWPSKTPYHTFGDSVWRVQSNHYSVIALLDEPETFDTQLIGSLSAWISLFPLLTTASSRSLPIDWSIWKRAFLQSSATSLCHVLMRMMPVSFNSWRNSCQNSKRNFLAKVSNSRNLTCQFSMATFWIGRFPPGPCT